MTSRRSRLKAVTNLPVRRKANSLQGNETTTVESLKPEKVFSTESKSDKVIAPSEVTQPDLIVKNKANDIANESNQNIPAIVVSSAVSDTSNQNCVSEYECSKINETDSDNLECIDILSSNCNLVGFQGESDNSVFKGTKHFKPNLVSSREKCEVESSEKINENGTGSSEEQTCPSSNNIINNNNNIIEENFKCYTLLSPHNVTLSPLAEYTITPLTPFNESTESHLSLAQDFEEVQIFTEVETAEFYEHSSNVTDNCESVIETEPLEPVLTNLTDFNSDHEENNSSFENFNSNYIEPRSSVESSVLKPGVKPKQVQQIRDSNVLENAASLGASNVSSDVALRKQSMSSVKRRRSKCNDLTKKIADAKKEFQKKYEKIKPDRSTLKMIDLIFYNPATNPMESKAKYEKKGLSAVTNDEIHDLLAEESVDEPEPLDSTSSGLSDKGDMDNASQMPVPQVKIGLDGEIILDEKSLIIETTDAKKRREHLKNSVPVFEDRGCKVSYYRGKSRKTKDWADFETKRFYKALNTIGPDFTLMQQYFPKRSRLELKNKFKREERLNRHLIDRALNNPSEFDMTQLEKDLAVEKEAEEEKIEMRLGRILRQTPETRPRKPRIKSSLLSREMTESDGESENNQSKSLNASSKTASQSEKSKKEKEFDFVFQKLLMKESEQKSRSVLKIPSFKKAFRQSDYGVT